MNTLTHRQKPRVLPPPPHPAVLEGPGQITCSCTSSHPSGKCGSFHRHIPVPQPPADAPAALPLELGWACFGVGQPPGQQACCAELPTPQTADGSGGETRWAVMARATSAWAWVGFSMAHRFPVPP